MAEQRPDPAAATHEVRKYPNRRYYDTTSRCHLTLEGVHELILGGTEVRVTDSKSGEDITAAVLTQIILKLETPKLQVFPVELLHQVIRTNGRLVKDFVEQYLPGSLRAFLKAQERVGSQMREGFWFPGGMPRDVFSEWTKMAMGPFAHSWLNRGEESRPGEGPSAPGAGQADQAAEDGGRSAGDSDLRRELEALKEEVRALRRERERPSGDRDGEVSEEADAGAS